MLVLIPAILVLIIPLVFLVAISLMEVATNAVVPENMLSLLSSTKAEMGYRQDMFRAFTDLLSPMFFLAVPIVTSVAVTASAFIAERNNGVLETMILSPIESNKLFNAKVKGCFAFSIMISVASFIVFIIISAIGSIILETPFFMSLNWTIIFFLLTPVLTFFVILLVTLLSHVITSLNEGLQIMGYILLPIIIMFLLQYSGLVKINEVFLLILVAVFAIADIILFNLSSKKFFAEKILTKVYLADREGKTDEAIGG